MQKESYPVRVKKMKNLFRLRKRLKINSPLLWLPPNLTIDLYETKILWKYKVKGYFKNKIIKILIYEGKLRGEIYEGKLRGEIWGQIFILDS